MTDRHPDHDQLVELALAEPGADEQERLSAHLAACPICRDEYLTLSEGLQQTLAASPAVAPPAGFSGRVLAAMGAAEFAVARPRPTRRVGLLVAAAALVGLLAGIGGTLVGTTLLERGPASTQHQTVAAPLLTSSGQTVGSAGLATLEERTYLLLHITVGTPGNSYECILVARDGSRTSGGTWTLSDEYGTGAASGSWLVPLPGERPVAVELVSPSGTVWSRGTF